MVNAGRILILAKGAWNSSVNYTQLDLVSYNSIAYLARQASVGVNPSTDTQMVYWMPFGSAASIATTSTPGLVMPDGTTITITNTGLIKAVLGINDVSDVTITSPTNGQVLKYNSSTSKWENGSLGTAAAKDATSTITSGSTDLIESGAVYSANQTLTQALSDVEDNLYGNDSVSVTADGTKSYAQMMASLFALVDMAKVKKTTIFAMVYSSALTTYAQLTLKQPTGLDFMYMGYNGSKTHMNNVIYELSSTGYCATESNGVYTDNSSEIVQSGRKFYVIY